MPQGTNTTEFTRMTDYNPYGPIRASNSAPIVQPTYNPASYKSALDPNNPLSSMINNIGGMLRPQKAFTTDVMTYDQYAAPQRAAFDQWGKDFRGEFEQSTLNPWNTKYANSAAAGGMSRMGNAKSLYESRRQGLERQGYYDPLLQANDQFESGVINPGYMSQLQNYYNSPTAFNNIGGSSTPTTNWGNFNPYGK